MSGQDASNALYRAAASVVRLLSPGTDIDLYLACRRDDVLRLALRLECYCRADGRTLGVLIKEGSVPAGMRDEMAQIESLLATAPWGLVCGKTDLVRKLLDPARRGLPAASRLQDARKLRGWASPLWVRLNLGYYRHALKNYLFYTGFYLEDYLKQPDNETAYDQFLCFFRNPSQWRKAWMECLRKLDELEAQGCLKEDLEPFRTPARIFQQLDGLRLPDRLPSPGSDRTTLTRQALHIRKLYGTLGAIGEEQSQ